MATLSPFHEMYRKNKEFYDKEAKKLLKNKFMERYAIGNTIYNMYFNGMNGRKYRTDGIQISNHHMVIQNKLSKTDDYIEEHNNDIKRIAERLKVESWVVKELNEKYTVSELESARWKDGEIVVHESCKMLKPSGFRMSMYSHETCMV